MPTFAWKANSAGQIVGTWTASGSLYHGFVRNSNGSIIAFDVPKEAQIFPQAINTSGQVAGLVWDSVDVLHGFTGTGGGSYRIYNFPSGTQYASAQLNDAGQVTGYDADRNFTAHGYLRDTNGTFTTLNEPGQVLANAINAAGILLVWTVARTAAGKAVSSEGPTRPRPRSNTLAPAGSIAARFRKTSISPAASWVDTRSPPAVAAIPPGTGLSLLESTSWES